MYGEETDCKLTCSGPGLRSLTRMFVCSWQTCLLLVLSACMTLSHHVAVMARRCILIWLLLDWT